MTREELRNAINNACDIMRREGFGLGTAERLTIMDYMERNSWLLSPSRRRMFPFDRAHDKRLGSS